MPVRLWLAGLVCILCGMASRIVFDHFSPPADSRAVAYFEAEFQIFWYGLGQLLFLIELLRRASQADSAKKRKFVGCACLLWLVGLIAAIFAAMSSVGD